MIRRIGRSIWSRVEAAGRGLTGVWWWALPAAALVGTLGLLALAVQALPRPVATILTVGAAFGAWSVGTFLVGVVTGSTLTYQRQERIPPSVPVIQPTSQQAAAMESPDFYKNLAEQFASAEEDAEPGQSADEEAEVPRPAVSY